MAVYTVLLVAAGVRTGAATVAWLVTDPARRDWRPVAQGLADICCALLLRACFDDPFRLALGWKTWPLFLFAMAWSAKVWIEGVWSLTGSEADGPFTSVLGAFGIGISSGLQRVGSVLWHVCFVAPSIVCTAFHLFGVAAELPPR